MGFFNRRAAPADANTTTATGTREPKQGIFSRRRGPATHTHHDGNRAFNSRPTFGQWIKATGLDIVSMAVMGAIGLGVYMADPAPSRSFPSKFQASPSNCDRVTVS
jgi:diacylglycerol diphosphate phosphatase / phosphatidate phosphatase